MHRSGCQAAVLTSRSKAHPTFLRHIHSGGSLGMGLPQHCLPAGSSPKRSRATCSPRGRGQACVTRKKTLPGWTRGMGERLQVPAEAGAVIGADRRPRACRGAVSQVPSPGPPGPRQASYITGRARRTAPATGGRSSPTSAGDSSRSGEQLPTPSGQAGLPGFQFPALALAQPQKQTHRHHNKGGDAAAAPE